MLGNAEPTNNIVKMLFARDQDEIVISTLCNWCRKKKDIHQKLVDALVFTMTTVNFTIFNGKFETKIDHLRRRSPKHHENHHVSRVEIVAM